MGWDRCHGWGQPGARVGHGLVSAWPALALVGSFELLMMLIRAGHSTRAADDETKSWDQAVPSLVHEGPPELPAAPTLEQTIRARYEAGHSQRAIARELHIDRRKVKRILGQAA